MEKFYLAPLKIDKSKYLRSKIEIGVIFAEGGRGRVTVIDPRDDKLGEDLIKSRAEWTELSRDKADYLIKIDKEKRIDNHKKGLFEKIKQLKINEECLINKERFTVKNIDGEKYTFLKKDGGERTKTMTMTEIDSLENVEYYLCIKSYGRIKEGTIIVKEGGERKEYPGGVCVGNIGEDRVSKTTRGEAVFMKEVPLEQRVEMHEDKLWEKIDKLKVNDECCLRDDRDRTAYRIIMINVEHDGVKYSLKSARGGLKKEVNQRDIVPVVNKREAEIKEESEISLFVKCKDFNLTIIDPQQIKKIEEVNELKIMERMLVIKGTKHTARVRWKGLVNDVISMGCEMDEDFDRGYDGKYKGKELFKTCKNKGVIMPVKIEEIYQTCEREHDQYHGGLRKTKDNVLEEESICCIKEETMKSEDKGRDIVIRENIRGRYMWRGEVNGEKCVGVDLDKSPMIRGYNFEGLIKKVRLFEYASLKGAIFAEQDICRSLHCTNNNVDFVNPTNIKSFDCGKSFDKMLMLKQNNNSLVVRLRWKGGVDGRLCLGCELAKDCEYGGAGILRDGGVFKSEGKRGVLIEVDEGVTCCEGGETRHKEVETRSNKTIEDVCICCVERGESQINEEVILREGLAGTMKWRGRINGEECIGVELERSVNEGSDGSFRGLRLFQCGSKKGVLMKRADITDTLRCDIINMDVVNHTNIEIKTSFKEQSLFLVLRDNNKSQLLEVRGMVNVVQRECLGCVLPQTHQYGTDGSFGGSRLFKCDNNKGVLIYREDLDCLKDNPKHKEIKVAVNSYIKEDNICCINKGVKKSPDKIVKVKINDHKIFGKALWTGCINGVNVLGLDLDIPGESGTDGTFCGVNLFQCIKGKGYLYLGSVDEAQRIEFIKDIYLQNNCDIRDIERGREDMEGRLVSVEGDPRVFGRVKFCVTIMGESLKAVKINDDYAARCLDFIKDKVFSKNVDGEENVIIVKSKYVKLFKEDFKFIRGSDIFIDPESIKVKEGCEFREIKKGDIVSYENRGERCYGRIERVELWNDVSCVSVVNTMKVREQDDEEEKYIKEDKVTKVSKSLEYLQDPIIDPNSIVTFKEIKDEDLSVGDEVEFKLKMNLQKFTGNIVMMIEANDVPSAIVGLTSPNENIKRYLINEIKPFKDIRGLKKDCIIVVLNTLRRPLKKIIFCESNKVSLFNPQNVKLISGAPMDDKVISFTSVGETVVALLKFSGVVEGERVLGCEMRKKSLWGTDGVFGGKRLFKCEAGKGVMIVMDKVEECCVKRGKCKELKTVRNEGISGSSICCAQSTEKLRKNSQIKLGERVMKRNERGGPIFGTCRWMGVVNGKEVIGMDMLQGYEAEKDECLDELSLFDCPYNKRGLFLAEQFTYDALGQRYCHNNAVLIVDDDNIKSVTDGERLQKRMKVKVDQRCVVVDLRWRGVINGVKCVGCEMSRQSDHGTEGVFGGRRLFDCVAGRGVLMNVAEWRGSCEEGGHRGIIKYDSGNIDPDSICCVETLEKLTLWMNMNIGSKVSKEEPGKLYGVNKKTGKCKWIGKVNGEEAVGVKMKDYIKTGTKGSFSIFELFNSKEMKGVIFLSKDIEHDYEGEKIKFKVDNVVDVTKSTWGVKIDKSWKTNVVNEPEIGPYVSARFNEKEYKGEQIWIGTICGIKCVGIDLEKEFIKGMNDVINDKRKFDCPPQHGVLTTLNNVHLIEGELKPTFNEDGMINADKYLKCEQRWKEEYLRNDIRKDGPVFVIIIKDEVSRRRKGTLRWSGTMNGEFVAVVELAKDYVNGTNGRFWRRRLIKCEDKRSVAVSWKNIQEYYPYIKEVIPQNKRKFEDIDVNSSVIYYIPVDGRLTNYYGTVKWTGMNEDEEYLYGIELDDRYKDGTDGVFKGQRLFKCAHGHGVLAQVKLVAPDTRFIETVYTDEDVDRSEVCDIVQYSIPVKTARGEHCGIQGNANSCYFDSSIFALFSKSDVLDFMISRLLNEEEQNPTTKDFREILSSQIVYPLRKFGFVSFHHTKDMRAVIKDYGGKFEEMTKHETDMENVGALLEKLCRDKPFLSLKTFTGFINKGMFLQLFFILNKPSKYISSQQMLDMSMAQNDIMFEKPPTCLIIQAPRDAKGINAYEYVLPSKTIEISNLCSSHFKKCLTCKSRAQYQCKKCVETTLRTKDGLFCQSHKCHHKDLVKYPKDEEKSNFEVQMKLKAIICIEKAHFVSYVKEDEFKKEWVFFDSMSTQNLANNYAVPKVSFDNISTKFLNSTEEDMKEDIEGYKNDPRLKRIVKDSYIFVYHNTSLTCY